MGAIVQLTDWITLRGASSADVVIQSVRDWVDAQGYADAVFYLAVRDYSGSPTVHYQTSPTEDEVFWDDMATEAVTSTTSQLAKVLFSSASVPLARFVRYKVTATGAWTLTFKIGIAFKNS